MRRHVVIIVALALPTVLAAQSQAVAAPTPNGAMLTFQRFADIFGSRLVAAFDSIPASKYDYRPTPVQQSIGYIAQHLEEANYSLCERVGDLKHSRAAKDSLADTVKAHWPKDTLVARLRSSLEFCDTALDRTGPRSPPSSRAASSRSRPTWPNTTASSRATCACLAWCRHRRFRHARA